MPLYHLTFGRNIPRKGGNDFVTDLDWQMFCEEVLDSYFDGYMVTDANGCWKSEHELTKTVSIDTDIRADINDVVQEYKEMFDQDAVGLYITPSMEFI
tara:strand:+ start:236 stop:529 length:294 start_codon:yes stop_codon:yes gene_type:complete